MCRDYSNALLRKQDRTLRHSLRGTQSSPCVIVRALGFRGGAVEVSVVLGNDDKPLGDLYPTFRDSVLISSSRHYYFQCNYIYAHKTTTAFHYAEFHETHKFPVALCAAEFYRIPTSRKTNMATVCRETLTPWCQASASMQMRSVLFWDFTQRKVVFCYRRFGSTC
jgi:hypothetical protein